MLIGYGPEENQPVAADQQGSERQHGELAAIPENALHLAPAAAQGEQNGNKNAGPDGAVGQHIHWRDMRQLTEIERKKAPDGVGQQTETDAGQMGVFVHPAQDLSSRMCNAGER